MQRFLASEEWDAPFFKCLAHNDTGSAAGHQGGMVLPKDLRRFLPSLDEAVTSEIAPTTDRYLSADMFLGGVHLADGVIRYQLQTWGGKRSAESRITDGLRPLRDHAAADDVLLFQRRLDAFDRFRLILVKQNTPGYAEIVRLVAGRRWGPLYLEDAPVSQAELITAGTEIGTLTQQPFQVQRVNVVRVESRQNRIARSQVFRERVRLEYERRCAVSGIAIATPKFVYEVESAHVVPVSKGGTDDIRNGLTLTQTLHWAFDRGLFGVLSDRSIFIAPQVSRMKENSFLRQYERKTIAEAKTVSLRVHKDAFAWHMENVVCKWK